jgi:hypothetical protein
MRNRDSISPYNTMHKALHSLSHAQLTPEIQLSTAADKEDCKVYSFALMIRRLKITY